MIAIVDGGSTKCDWYITNADYSQHFEIQTIGFNPNLISEQKILHEIENTPLLSTHKNNIKKIYFFGAGCGTQENKKRLQKIFQKHFVKAQAIIENDLMGAVRSVYNGEKAVIGILGTGSNSCFFDGNSLLQISPSLGYILGDEGSGNALGKAILRAYFMKTLPEELSENFKKKYHLTIQDVLENLYQKSQPNVYLAKFSEFIFEYKNDDFIKRLIKIEFQKYIDYQILPYLKYQPKEFHFVGSIAHHYKDLLIETVQENNIKIDNIIKKPIDGLVKSIIK